MKIQKAIVSTDDNPLYYDFWPIVAKAWRNFEIAPVVAVIGNLNLNYEHGQIIKVPFIDNIPSGFIAQVIRFIIPCLFPEEIFIIGDIDMLPLNKDYFTKQVLPYDNDSIIIFSSDLYKNQLRYPMCYIAAKGKLFQKIIGLTDTSWPTIKSFIEHLYKLEMHWDTDELFFAQQLHKSPLLKKTIFLARSEWDPYNNKRIDRSKWQYSTLGLLTKRYIDAHCVRPLKPNIKKLQMLIDFIYTGSDKKTFVGQIFKKPLTQIYFKLKHLKQIWFENDNYEILEIIPAAVKKNKVISFSLYGNDPRYVNNLGKTLMSYNKILPDWKCRVYVGCDISSNTLQLLKEHKCEVFVMKGRGVDCRYMTWRFLAVEDESLEAIIVRDIDSQCTFREKRMVDEWLISDKKFHIVRDHPNHSGRIMGGIWGVKKGLLNISIKKESKKILMTDKYGMDMEFLNEIIYPLIKNDVIIHDSFPRFPDEHPIVMSFDLDGTFIGEITTDSDLHDRDRKFLDNFQQRFLSLDSNS